MRKNNYYKIYLVLSLTLLGLVSCSDKKQSFVVNGKLDNVTGGYFLAARELSDTVIVDTIAIDGKGKFSIKGDVDTLTVMSMYFNDNAKYAYVLIDKGWAVNMSGDIIYPDLLEIKGGDVNDDLTAFKKQNKDLLKRRIEILKSVEDSSYVSDEIEVTSDKNYLIELKNINFELSNIAADYIKENPRKISSVMLMDAFFRDATAIPRLDDCLSLLRGAAADHYLSKELADYSAKIKRSAEGAVSPEFSRKDLNGKSYSLSSFRGKYLLLFFVSTTCPLCDAQRPDVLALYEKFKKEKTNIEFLTVVLDTEEEAITSEIRKSVKWPLLIEDGGWTSNLLDTYNIHKLPFYILVSPTGVISRRDIPLNMVEEVMQELTGKK